jgi:hypothetical protein
LLIGDVHKFYIRVPKIRLRKQLIQRKP